MPSIHEYYYLKIFFLLGFGDIGLDGNKEWVLGKGEKKKGTWCPLLLNGGESVHVGTWIRQVDLPRERVLPFLIDHRRRRQLELFPFRFSFRLIARALGSDLRLACRRLDAGERCLPYVR